MKISFLPNTIILKPLWLRDLLGLAIGCIVYILILEYRSESIIRMISIKVDAGFGEVLPVLALFWYLAFRSSSPLRNVLGLTFTLAVFGFTLSGEWVAGQSQTTIISGLLPLTDARLYYVDAIRLINGLDVQSFTAQKPIFAGLLSVFLLITKFNLMESLAIFTAINGLCCYIACNEIRRTHGALPATLVMAIVFLFYRKYSGAVMTEQIGVSLGILAFIALWKGVYAKSKTQILFGVFFLTIALNVRAGAMFMLPCLIIWAGIFFRRENEKVSWNFMLICILLVATGFLVNLILIRYLATPDDTLFANFSYALYGIASGGKGFAYISQVHPEVYGPEHARIIYRLAFELIRDNPLLFISGVFSNWSNFFISPWYGMYSYVMSENAALGIFAQRSLLVLAIIGFVRWVLKPGDAIMGLIMVLMMGTILSVPFVPPRDASGLRLYAASLMVLAVLPSMGIKLILENMNLDQPIPIDEGDGGAHYIEWLGAIYILLMIIGPIIVKAVGDVPFIPISTCPQQLNSVMVRFDQGTFVTIVRDENNTKTDGLEYHYSYFKNEMHDLSGSLINWPVRLHPPVSLLVSLDYRKNEDVLVVIPPNMMPLPPSYAELCGHFEKQKKLERYRIFYVQLVGAEWQAR